MMALIFLKMVIAVLFAMSFFHKMYSRSVSMFMVLVIGFLWMLLTSFKMGDVGLWIIGIGLLFMYWRAMQKPATDKVL